MYSSHQLHVSVTPADKQLVHAAFPFHCGSDVAVVKYLPLIDRLLKAQSGNTTNFSPTFNTATAWKFCRANTEPFKKGRHDALGPLRQVEFHLFTPEVER